MKPVIILCFLAFGFSNLTVAQTDSIAAEAEIFDVVEKMPEFPGGMDALYMFIGKNFHYPDTCVRAKIQGRVYVTFVVEKDGTITNQYIRKGVHPALDAEALRVISKMPKWNPGKQQGMVVRVRYNLPVICKLN